jgi:TRAP-type mannitol/chloroaromatic compound transport system permease small subunit
MIKRIVLGLDRITALASRACGALACVAMLLMLLNVMYDVLMRYVFNDVSIGMQELEWHLFATVFMLGTPYAMQRDGHVRVDIFYDRWSQNKKAWLNLFGACVFVIPFVVLVSYYGYDFVLSSYDMGEGSGDPGGLPYRWIVKSLIPISFALMAVAALGMVTFALRVLWGDASYDPEHKEALT